MTGWADVSTRTTRRRLWLRRLRSKDELRRSALRLIKASLQSDEKSLGKALGDDGVIQSCLGRRNGGERASMLSRRAIGRTSWKGKRLSWLSFSSYLPQQLSAEEITEIARSVIGETGAGGPGDRGKVMGKLMPQVKGKADGKLVSQIVGELLAGKSD